MDSSTSHFKVWMPGRAGLLLLVMIAAWVAGAFYTLHLNPEIQHNIQGAAIRKNWAEKMTREHGHKIVIYGGSSCEFSIDGERMLLQHQLPVVNYGGPAGLGPVVLSESALDCLGPGDTLIVALEPGLLTRPFSDPAFGAQFSFAVHRNNWVLRPRLGVGRMSWFQAATSLRPGGYHFFTMLGKILGGKPLYRYKLSDYRASGWKQTDARTALDGPAGHGEALSDEGRQLLSALRSWCDEHRVQVCYSLPWSYAPQDVLHSFQRDNIQFLLQVCNYLPVLKDPRLGANSAVDLFADTALHLNQAGSAMRTDELARQIKAQEFWSTDELKGLTVAP